MLPANKFYTGNVLPVLFSITCVELAIKEGNTIRFAGIDHKDGDFGFYIEMQRKGPYTNLTHWFRIFLDDEGWYQLDRSFFDDRDPPYCLHVAAPTLQLTEDDLKILRKAITEEYNGNPSR